MVESMDQLMAASKTKQMLGFTKRPTKIGEVFRMDKYDFEHFNLTIGQRFLAFGVSLFLAVLLFFYSLTRLFFMIFNPVKFVLPYVASNVIFFLMFGFLCGFKSYFRNLFSRTKRPFTVAFIASTLITLYGALFTRMYFFHLLLVVCQIVSFVCFSLTFIPGGASGMGSLFGLVFRK